MIHRFTLLWLLGLLLTLPARLRADGYTPDILRPDYARLTIALPADGDAVPPVCTLVRHAPPAHARAALLYVHGYNDYFFQSALGDTATRRGYAFYAIDLRDYGRSIRPGRDPFYTDDLRDYHADIDSALAVIRREGYGRVVLMGHSTGGLIAADYVRRHGKWQGIVALALNSPFLDWNFGWAMKRIAIPAVGFLGRLWPRWKVQGEGGDNYARTLLAGQQGEWTYDTLWKKPHGWPKRAGWLGAVTRAQRRVRCWFSPQTVRPSTAPAGTNAICVRTSCFRSATSSGAAPGWVVMSNVLSSQEACTIFSFRGVPPATKLMPCSSTFSTASPPRAFPDADSKKAPQPRNGP